MPEGQNYNNRTAEFQSAHSARAYQAACKLLAAKMCHMEKVKAWGDAKVRVYHEAGRPKKLWGAAEDCYRLEDENGIDLE